MRKIRSILERNKPWIAAFLAALLFFPVATFVEALFGVWSLNKQNLYILSLQSLGAALGAVLGGKLVYKITRVKGRNYETMRSLTFFGMFAGGCIFGPVIALLLHILIVFVK